jgi:hypothetical protein
LFVKLHAGITFLKNKVKQYLYSYPYVSEVALNSPFLSVGCILGPSSKEQTVVGNMMVEKAAKQFLSQVFIASAASIPLVSAGEKGSSPLWSSKTHNLRLARGEKSISTNQIEALLQNT